MNMNTSTGPQLNNSIGQSGIWPNGDDAAQEGIKGEERGTRHVGGSLPKAHQRTDASLQHGGMHRHPRDSQRA